MADLDVLLTATLTVDGAELRVIELDLDEAISEVSELSCVADAGDGVTPDPSEVIDKPALVVIGSAGGAQARSFAGTVIDAEIASDDEGSSTLRLVIAPAMWALHKRASSRIFQEMSAIDIAKEVLTGAGVPADRQELQLAEDHPARTYTAQYRETDLDFLKRLLFEEGISFVIHTRDDRDVVILTDATDGIGDVEGGPLRFFEAFGMEGAGARVTSLQRAVSVRSDKTFARDFDPERPSVLAEGSAESSDEGPHALEIYDHPARAVTPAEAARHARVLLDSVQAERDVIEGETGSIALVPGLRVTIEGHPYEPLNRALLVTRTRVSFSQLRHFQGEGARGPSLTCAFWGVPTSATRYRPPRVERAAIARGADTAIVTGPPKEEIHTDASGRIKARFHWDRSGKTDDTSSAWMRTSQVPTGGSMLLPRVGWEVEVRHLEGDPDRPMVMARMMNALAPPPYALPGAAGKSALQTATSPGGGSVNEIAMSDTAGGEEMFFNASKDKTTHVKNHLNESVANDAQKTVAGNQTRSVTNSATIEVGADQTMEVGGAQSIAVETYMTTDAGSHALSIAGGRDMMIGGDHRAGVGGASTHDVGNSAIDLVVGAVSEDTLAKRSVDVGAALVNLCVGDRSVVVGKDRTERAIAAKLVAVNGQKSVSVEGALDVKVAGAIVNVAKGDKTDQSGAAFTELAAGAQMIKADNVVLEAETALTLVMGASILSLTPVSVAVIGTSVKLDGDVADTAALILDN